MLGCLDGVRVGWVLGYILGRAVGLEDDGTEEEGAIDGTLELGLPDDGDELEGLIVGDELVGVELEGALLLGDDEDGCDVGIEVGLIEG